MKPEAITAAAPHDVEAPVDARAVETDAFAEDLMERDERRTPEETWADPPGLDVVCLLAPHGSRQRWKFSLDLRTGLSL
jgi:hypothetical protein